MKRPTTDGDVGSYCTTPTAAMLIQLAGGIRSGGVTVSEDERRALERLYGFTREAPRRKPAEPAAPRRDDFPPGWDGARLFDDAERAYKAAVRAWNHWVDPSEFHQAGANVNLMRAAEVDGLRIMAWLAKHLEPGEDPLKVLVELAANADLDVDPQDVDWATGAEEGEEE